MRVSRADEHILQPVVTRVVSACCRVRFIDASARQEYLRRARLAGGDNNFSKLQLTIETCMAPQAAKPYVVPRGGVTQPPGAQRVSHKKRIRLTPWKTVHLLHRLAILAMALQYAVLNFQASWYTVLLLTQRDIPALDTSPKYNTYMETWIGSTTIRESPLVADALENSTLPRNGTLFLHNSTSASFSPCEILEGVNSTVHNDTFHREVFAALSNDTSYFFDTDGVELIVPVIDCSSWMVQLNAPSSAVFYFLMRNISIPDSVLMMFVSLSNQEYSITEQNMDGPAAVATMAIFTNLTATTVDYIYLVSFGFPFEPLDFRVCFYRTTLDNNLWSLGTIPRDSTSEIPKNLSTAAMSGFFISSRTEQAHILNELPVLEQDPILVITRAITHTKTILRDSWAWVHFLQFFLGVELLSNLVPLVLVSYRSFLNGTLWVGDAFVSISSTISARGAAIIISWHLSKYWTIRELCAHDAYFVSELSNLTIYENIARADLLGLYLSACGILGIITRERVDPLLATACFHFGFGQRARLNKAFPTLVMWASEWAYEDAAAGVLARLDAQNRISPMQFWTSHELEHTPFELYMIVLGPVTFTLNFICIQIIATKIYRYIRPSTTRVLQRTTDRSGKEQSGGETMALYKRVLTLFEIATGAELENRFGLMSDYENYVYFKGMKFASADGVYSNGFVIVNDKFVMPTSAYFKVVLMKLLRRRYTSVYVYEMSGTTVQQTARLVYPDTMSFSDLLRLDISILS